MNEQAYPETILYPKSFQKSLAAGFDGVFDWTWTQGCFGETKITPMDFDGVVERHRHFLIFESKNIGVPIPTGQELTLGRLRIAKTFTVIKIWGKSAPEYAEIIHQNGKTIKIAGFAEIKNKVEAWFFWANSH